MLLLSVLLLVEWGYQERRMSVILGHLSGSPLAIRHMYTMHLLPSKCSQSSAFSPCLLPPGPNHRAVMI